MTGREFIYLVSVVKNLGQKVLVEDNYSDEQLKELISALSALHEEACWK